MKYFLFAIFLSSCTPLAPSTNKEPVPATSTSVSSSTSTSIATAVDCTLVVESLVLANQTAKLPQAGNFVLESHLITKLDPPGYPATMTTNIPDHLSRSCAILQKYGAKSDCSDVYTTIYTKEWTPAEKGLIGQGSVGDLRPSVEEEMWSFNLYWTSENKPAPGTKYLASYNGRNVVMAGGYETGPGSAALLGGLQGEVFWGLKAQTNSLIKIGRLVNQSAPLGPVSCK